MRLKIKHNRAVSILLCILILCGSITVALNSVTAADYNWVGSWELYKNGSQVGSQVNLWNSGTWNADTIQDAYVRMDKTDLSAQSKDDIAADLVANYSVKIDSNYNYNYAITAATYNESLSIENELWIFTLTIDNRGDSIQWNGKGALIFNVGVPDSSAGDTITNITNWRLLSKETLQQVVEVGYGKSTVSLPYRIEESEYDSFGEVLKETYYLSLQVNGSYGNNIYDIKDIVYVSATETTVTYKIVTKDTLYWNDGSFMEIYITVKPMNAPGEKYYNPYEWQIAGYSQTRDIGLAIILSGIDYESDVKGKEEAFADTLKATYSEIRVHENVNDWPWHNSAIKDIIYDAEKSKDFSSGIRTVAAYKIVIYDEYYENNKLVEFYVAVSAPADFGDLSTITVPSKEPQGITMNLFDYWTVTDDPGDEYGNPWNAVYGWENELSSAKYNGGINSGHTLKFFNTSPTNGDSDDWDAIRSYGVWNHSTTNARQNVTKIVENLLYGGYPKLQLDQTFGSDVWSDFKSSYLWNLRDDPDTLEASRAESLGYLFDPAADHTGKATYKNVSGLLQLNDQGYYYYDSKLNFAQFDKLTNEFLLYNTWGVIPAGDSPHGQFFPFNKAEEVFSDVSADDEVDENGQRTLTQFTADEVNSRSDIMNHHFGFTMKVDFQQPVNGQVNHRIESVAEDMVFKFGGDDDCWVFVDGVLVLDLGGVHSGVYGEINFATGEVRTGLMDNEIGSGVAMSGGAWTTTTLRALFDAAGVANDDDIAWGTGIYENTFAFDTLHTIQLFYMERGHWDSNFAMYFNLQPRVPHKIYKVDEDGNPLEDAIFALYAAEPINGVYKEGEIYHTANEFEKVNAFYNINNPNDPGNPRRPASGEPDPMTEEFFSTDETGYVTLSGIDFATRASSEGKIYYILEEIDPPEGARKLLTPIVLEYGYPDPNIEEKDKPYKGVFTVLNQYETGAYASFSAILEDNGDKMYYATTTEDTDDDGNKIFDITGTTSEIQSPHQESALLFAVPMIYTDIGEGFDWYPIYGSNTHGYRIVDIYQPEEYYDHTDSEKGEVDGVTDPAQNAYRWALRHNLLAAAMRQVADVIGPDWYFKYETIMTADGKEAYSRFTAELNNLPGDASRYLVNNKNVSEFDVNGVDLRLMGVLVDAEAIIALLNNQITLDQLKAMSDEEKYLALQDYLTSLDFESYWDANYETNNGRIREWLDVAYVQRGAENTSRERGVNLADINTFTRYYGSVFYVPNERRELRVLKQDVEGNPIPNAEFGLFESFNDAVDLDAPIATGITDENGLLIFSIEPDHDEYGNVIPGQATMDWNMAANDSIFWVREIEAPDGFVENEAIVQVYVGDLTIYANASAYRAQKNGNGYVTDGGNYIPELIDSGVLNETDAANLMSGANGLNTDGVWVLASVGKLFQSMEKFADTLLNSTLLDIYAYDYLFVAENLEQFRDPEEYTARWVNMSGTDPVLMHFWDQALQYASSEYSDNHVLPEGYTFSQTENGYLWMRPQQSSRADFEAMHGTDDAIINSRRDELLLNDGSPVDISRVFSPVNVIVIRDEYSTPHMMIEKEQQQNDGDRTKDRLRVYGDDIVTYYLTVTSDGNDTARNVVVTDTVPEGLTLVEGSISHGGTVDENNTITWVLGDVPTGTSITVSFQVIVPYVDVDTEWHNIGILSYEDNHEIPSNEVIIEEKVDEAFGSLKVTKLTTKGTTEDIFTFKVTFILPEGEAPSGSYTYNGAENGTLAFEKNMEDIYTCEIEIHLRHEESVTFENLPVGTRFTVKETELNGYVLSEIIAAPESPSQNNQPELELLSGEIENAESYSVTFVNANYVTLPSAGYMARSTYYLSGSLLLVCLAVYASFLRKKKIKA